MFTLSLVNEEQKHRPNMYTITHIITKENPPKQHKIAFLFVLALTILIGTDGKKYWPYLPVIKNRFLSTLAYFIL